MLASAHSAGALRWFFTLFNRMKEVDPMASAQACLRLLMCTAQAHSERNNRWHALLKARHGLYGNPFDLELFDFELPSYLKTPSASQSTYANVTQGSESSSSYNPYSQSKSDGSFMRNLRALGCTSDKSASSLLGSKLHADTVIRHACGLLEVEPLHFVVSSTSDGARVERLESSPTGSPAPPVVAPPLLSQNVTSGYKAPSAQSLQALFSAFDNLQAYKEKVSEGYVLR